MLERMCIILRDENEIFATDAELLHVLCVCRFSEMDELKHDDDDDHHHRHHNSFPDQMSPTG